MDWVIGLMNRLPAGLVARVEQWLQRAGSPIEATTSGRVDTPGLRLLPPYPAQAATSRTPTTSGPRSHAEELLSMWPPRVVETGSRFARLQAAWKIRNADLFRNDPDCGWRIGTLYVPEFSNQDGDNSVYLSDIAIDGMLLEPEGQENAYGGVMFYEAVRMGEVAVTAKGEDVFTMQDLAIEIDLPAGGEPMVFRGAADAFTAKPGAAEDPKTRAMAAALGYSDISGSFVIDGDWDPACEGSALTDNGDGTYSATFDVPAGDYEVKVALDGAWTENYGVDGAADGDNYAFSVAADGPVTFTWDSETKILTIEVGS